MEICNIFNPMNKENGNIIMFSQYAQDLTQMISEGRKILPSKFLALNVNYADINISKEWTDIFSQQINDKSKLIPNIFQNIYENSSVLCRDEKNIKGNVGNISKYEIMKNIFWDCLFDFKILQLDEKKISNISYIGDINLQSFNKHGNIGYNEIYCYIPSDAKKEHYILNRTNYDSASTPIITSPRWDSGIFYIEGFDNSSNLNNGLTLQIPTGFKGYTYNDKISISKSTEEFKDENPSILSFNTIIVLYDIVGFDDSIIAKDIPLALYIPQTFKSNNVEPVNKIISTDEIYGAGTSYGLRICTRYNLLPQKFGDIEYEVEISDNGYAELSYTLSEMAKTQSMMNDIINQMHHDNLFLKESLAAFKNNKTNVPYPKMVGGIYYWFINGKNTNMPVTSVEASIKSATDKQVSDEMEKYI